MKPTITFLVSCFSLVTSISTLFLHRFLYPTDYQCLVRLSPYSPALEAVQYSWKNFGSFFSPRAPLRGDANMKPKLEDSWKNYTFNGVISVPFNKLEALDVPPDFKPWPVKPTLGGGVAAVLGIHYQTNCLNLIRKYIHRDTHDYSLEREFDPARTPPEKLRAQVHQCFEVLRQELTCHIDTSVYLGWPDPIQVSAFNEDNAVRHKCRSHEAIKAWAEDHRVLPLHNATTTFENLYYPMLVE